MMKTYFLDVFVLFVASKHPPKDFNSFYLDHKVLAKSFARAIRKIFQTKMQKVDLLKISATNLTFFCALNSSVDLKKLNY